MHISLDSLKASGTQFIPFHASLFAPPSVAPSPPAALEAPPSMLSMVKLSLVYMHVSAACEPRASGHALLAVS